MGEKQEFEPMPLATPSPSPWLALPGALIRREQIVAVRAAGPDAVFVLLANCEEVRVVAPIGVVARALGVARAGDE